MPCRDGGPCEPTVSQSSYDAMKKRLDLATRLLCNVMTVIEGDLAVRWNQFDSDLKGWWEKHKKEDRQRKREEEYKKAEKRTKLRAEIKKMTEELNKLR